MPASRVITPYLWMLLSSFAFSIMGTCAHAVAEECPWQIVALSRCLLVLMLVGTMAWLKKIQLVFLRPGRLWIRSIAGSFSLVCTFYSLMQLPPSSVLTLTNTFPIWVALISWFLLKRKPSFRVWVAVLSAICGVAVIHRPELNNVQLAFWVALAGSLFTAIAMLGLHALKDVPTQAVVVHFSFVSFVFCLAALFLLPTHRSATIPSEIWVWLMMIGVGLSASIGQLFLTKAFTSGEPARVSVVGLSTVVFAVVWDILLWHHPIDGANLLGMSLILCPTAWVMLEKELPNLPDQEPPEL